MNEGRIEQVGTPEEIYSAPASPFVADFIGVMNFLHGEVIKSGKVLIGEDTLECETANIPEGSKVRVTVRPEDILCSVDDKNVANSFSVKVDSVEFLGSFCRLILSGREGFGKLMSDLSTQQVHELKVNPESTLTTVFPARSLKVFPESL